MPVVEYCTHSLMIEEAIIDLFNYLAFFIVYSFYIFFIYNLYIETQERSWICLYSTALSTGLTLFPPNLLRGFPSA